MANNNRFATVIRQLQVKLERQKLAVEATEQHIEAIRALEKQENDKEADAKSPKK